jgi:hypothetical protein
MKRRINTLFRRYPAASLASVLVFFISIESLFSFCTPIECPAFSDQNFDAWFPYREKQNLYFISSNNERDTISIDEIFKSQHEKAGFYAPSCTMRATMQSVPCDYYCEFSVYYLKDSGYKRLDFALLGTHFQADDVTEHGPDFNNPGEYKSTAYPSLSINGNPFTDVQLVEVDTTLYDPQARINNRTIKKLWLVKHQGLVAFEKYPSDGIWVKQ